MWTTAHSLAMSVGAAGAEAVGIERMSAWRFLLTMAVVLGAAVWVFAELARRWTVARRRAELSQWARENGYRLLNHTTELPEILRAIGGAVARAVVTLTRQDTRVIRLEIEPAGVSAAPPDASKIRHVLVRAIQSTWPATALRPVGADKPGASSAIDLYRLRAYPMLATPDRFTVHATTVSGAKALAGSAAGSLLPPDVGLLLAGNELMLDFTARPFDPIEFERMIVVADQVIAHLPVVQQSPPAAP
jgi:hypothetical protein